MKVQPVIILIFLLGSLVACVNTTTSPQADSVKTITSQNSVAPSKSSQQSISQTPENTPSHEVQISSTQTPIVFTSTITVTSTSTVTLTSTPQPSLVSHTWELAPILVQIEVSGGDGCCETYASPPDLVLYANGLFIHRSYDGGMYKMFGKKLDRKEICALLNTLDQVGFLDYDPSVYRDPMDGLPSTAIYVNAWKMQFIYGQVLEEWISKGGDWWLEECPDEDCAPPPVILPALSNAYKLLTQYSPEGLELLPTKQMLVWVDNEWKDYEPFPWPLKSISLKSLTTEAEQNSSRIVIEDNPYIVQDIEKNLGSGIFYVEGDLKRIVSARPLWPAETHYFTFVGGLPTPYPIVPSGTTMSCYPEDGILPIP